MEGVYLKRIQKVQEGSIGCGSLETKYGCLNPVDIIVGHAPPPGPKVRFFNI